jgi:hypothetical protein
MAYVLLFAGDMRHTLLTGAHVDERKMGWIQGAGI